MSELIVFVDVDDVTDCGYTLGVLFLLVSLPYLEQTRPVECECLPVVRQRFQASLVPRLP